MFGEYKSRRLENWDYSQAGYYFVTVKLGNVNYNFGKIVDGEMILNQYGEMVKNQWLWLKKQYNYIEIDEFVIMLDHFHGILIIFILFSLLK